jgi:hypothetical protein
VALHVRLLNIFCRNSVHGSSRQWNSCRKLFLWHCISRASSSNPEKRGCVPAHEQSSIWASLSRDDRWRTVKGEHRSSSTRRKIDKTAYVFKLCCITNRIVSLSWPITKVLAGGYYGVCRNRDDNPIIYTYVRVYL